MNNSCYIIVSTSYEHSVELPLYLCEKVYVHIMLLVIHIYLRAKHQQHFLAFLFMRYPLFIVQTSVLSNVIRNINLKLMLILMNLLQYTCKTMGASSQLDMFTY